MKNKIGYIVLTLSLFSFISCGNYFKEYFVEDELKGHYRLGLIKNSDAPLVYSTQNLELDAIGMIENGYVNLGYSYFEKSDYGNEEEEAIEFAKEIGASAVLLQNKFERTKKVYNPVSQIYPISPRLPAVSNTNTTTTTTTKKGTTTTTTTTNPIVNPIGYPVYPVNPIVYPVKPIPNINYSIKFKDGKITEQKISTGIAVQLWNIPIEQRNYYAVPHSGYGVIIPARSEEREVEVHSYYASFWAKTNYPPALGVEVANLESSIKKELNIINGVVVWGVFRGSPASEAGIYRGDYLLSVNDEPIVSRLQMGELIRKNTGKTIHIKLLRDQEKLYKDIKLNNTTF